MTDRELLSVPEIEKDYGISRHRLYGLIADGLLPALRIGTKRVYVRRTAFEKFLLAAEMR